MRVRNDLSCTPVELPNGMTFRSITECALVLKCSRYFVARCINDGAMDALVARIKPTATTIPQIDVEQALDDAFDAVFPGLFGTARKDAA